jgi:hypothetical protein
MFQANSGNVSSGAWQSVTKRAAGTRLFQIYPETRGRSTIPGTIPGRRRSSRSRVASISPLFSDCPVSPRHEPSIGRSQVHGHIVDAVRTARAASRDPEQAHPAARPQTVASDCLIGIFRTSRQMPAGIADEPRQRQLVEPDDRNTKQAARRRSPRARPVAPRGGRRPFSSVIPALVAHRLQIMRRGRLRQSIPPLVSSRVHIETCRATIPGWTGHTSSPHQ